MFLFPKIQFIVATHSRFVIASVQPKNVYMMTEDKKTHKKTVTNAQLEEKHTKGLEPNRIIKEIMGAPLRDFEIQEKMQQLNNLLKTNYNDSNTTKILNELTQNLGKEDPFIMRVQHEIFMLKRKYD
jgi:hypothetical protein